MKTLLIGTLRFQRGRLFAASTAVILAVAFVVATLMLHAAYLGAVMNNLVNDVSKADVIVSPATSAVEDALGDMQTREYLDAVEKAPGVTASFEVYRSFAMTGEDSANTWQLYAFDVMPTAPEAFRGATLERGTWPTGTDVALSESMAHTRGLDVGDSLSYVVTLPSASGDGIEKPVTGKVSGIVPLPATPTPAMNYVSPELFATLSHSTLPEQVLLRADDPDAVVSSLRALAASQGHQISGYQSVPAPGVTQVTTRADYLDGMLKASTGEAQVMLWVGLTFSFIAVFVAILVVSNVFAIMIAQRARELALLRCIGARRRDLRTYLVYESLAVGLGGSLLGVLAGCALAYAVIGASRLGSVVSLAVVPPSWEAAGLGLAVGTVMALVAGLRPQALATRISPLSVMRATDEVVADAHPAKARAAGAILLVAGGLTLLWLGSQGGQGLAFALPGGAITFLGLLLALPFGVPPLLRGMTRCLHRFPTWALAGANAGRNPRRVTMTVTAMMVAVTLVSMFIVGAASMKESMIREIEARNPVDVIVDQAHLDDQTVRAVAALDGVRTSATLRGVAVYPVGNVPPASPEVTAAQSENDAVTSASYGTGGLLLAAGAPPALASVNRSDEAFAPADHTLYVSPSLVFDYQESVFDPRSQTARLDVGGTVVTLPYVESRFVPPYRVLVSEATLDELAPDAAVIEAWYSLDDTWDFRAAQELRSDAQEAATSASQELQAAAGVDYGNSTWPAVQAPGVDRLVYEGLAALLLLVVLALLVTSVVIALVGVSTTMSLSVIERQREIGLLRSIGMSTRQVRQSVVAEAVIVSLAATVLGVVLGIGFGAVGTVSALPASGTIPVRIEIPWWQVGAAVLVMVLAGVVAAWTPARRASRVSPVRALAESPT